MKKILFLISAIFIQNFTKASQPTSKCASNRLSAIQLRNIRYANALWQTQTEEEARQVYRDCFRDAYLDNVSREILANYGRLYRIKCKNLEQRS